MGKKDKSKKDKKEQKRQRIYYGILAGVIVVILAVIGGMLYVNTNKEEKKDENELAYTELIKMMGTTTTIEKIEMETGSNSVKVKLKDVEKEKRTVVPNIQAFIELVQDEVKAGMNVELIQKPQNALSKTMEIIFSALPFVMMAVLVGLILYMQGFGDKGKVYGGDENNDTGVTFDDVAGLDEERNELIEIVDFLKSPESFYEMGAKIPKGILLCGKPGTGKTLIAKAIAGEAGVSFISMSGSEFSEMFAGLGAMRVRRLFEKAKKLSPSIIFIDEIDAVGSKRTAGGGGVEADNNQTLNQLLVEMDGFETDETVIVLAATNRPEMLDKALLRAGRFDRQINIASPDLLGREAILKIHANNKKFDENINFKEIAGDTAGFTGAELANILNEAAIIATRKKKEKIQKSDIEEAVKKVIVGLEKHSRVVSDRDKNLTAYHEAGHALVSKFLPTQEDVKEVSIIPRGLAGGYTMHKTTEDKYYISKTEMQEKLIVLLGGRAAEKIALDDISTGASNDIEVATEIAKEMVTVYGMSERLGPISLKTEDKYEVQPFGENIGDVIGEEVRKLIEEAYKNAQIILSKNMDILDAVANRLLEKEIISSEEFEEFFR